MVDLFCSFCGALRRFCPMSWQRVLVLGLTFVQAFHGFVDALEGNCWLFGCNAVVKFDLHTEICCDGTVYVRDLDENGNEKTKCCLGGKSTMYDVETQECCGGVVIWKDSLLKGCCQGKIYNKNVYTCCEGKIKNKIMNPCCGNDPVDPRSPVQCCGGKIYDNSKQTCCNGIINNDIAECCGEVLWNPADDKCCRHNGAANLHISGFGTKCCGLHTYLPGEQLCCKSVVNNKIDNTIECCGNTTFNITTEVCCQGNVLPREMGKKSCCGGRLYDEDDEVCCRGEVRPGGDGAVRLVENSTTAYLSANQFECDGELITRSRKKNACCDKTAYNSADHICCELPDSSFKIVQKRSSQDRCCGRASYNPDSQGCCKSTDVFDLENEFCNENGVHAKYGSIEAAKPCLQKKLDKDKVCKVGENNEMPYNSNISVCTPRGVVALPEGLDICGNKTFKEDIFICCRGKIFTKEVDNETQECCPNAIDKETFIPTIQTCYNGRIEQTPEKYASFCKGKVYDNRTHECDVTGTIRSKEKIQAEPNVCWNNLNGTHDYFNNETEKCCKGHIIDAVFTCCAEESECCNAGDIQGYNRETHVCCSGVLREVPMKKPNCRGNRCPEPQDNTFLCCHGTPYEDVDGELTCDGNLLTGPLQNGGIICRGTRYNHGTDCCGDISYDNATEICCGGVVANKTASTSCCGNHFYNPMNSESLCCESNLYVNASGHGCCGGVKYNLKNESCCTTGGKTYVFPSNDGLCCSNGEDYDDTLHTCCDGLVHKYITSGTCCGNDVIRDPTREGCFKDRVYQLRE